MLLVACLLALAPQRSDAPQVELQPLPEGEIQPQVCVDSTGAVHLLVLTGDPASGELVYRRSHDEGDSWSENLKVGSGAVAMGHVRGGRMALGRAGRVHVAWPASALAKPRGPADASPLLYARLAGDAESFTTPRNVISKRYGLDGGSAIAADDAGHVWIAWHAPGDGGEGEDHRQVWVARSSDDGASFEPERAAWDEPSGACGCCSVSATWNQGRLYVLYRGALEGVHRGMFVLVSEDLGETFQGRELDQWLTERCPLSNSTLAVDGDYMFGGWVRAGAISIEDLTAEVPGVSVRMQRRFSPMDVPNASRKGTELNYPAMAFDASGNLLVAAMVDTQWGLEGRLDWRMYDLEMKLLAAIPDTPISIPPWGLVATFVRTDGSFVVLY